jgi:hypothetical protein
MDALQFFWLRYPQTHDPGRPERRLADAHMRARPSGLNSVAWLLWHLARCEDVGVNRFVVDGLQVLDEGDWTARMDAPWRHIGTGMTSDEVDDLSARIGIAALWAYWDAVGERTTRVLRDRPSESLGPAVDRPHLRRVVEREGILGPRAAWVEEAWAAWPCRGSYLAQLALAHHWGHLYDMGLVRGLLGEGEGR